MLRGNHLGKRSAQRLRRKHDREGERPVVLGHRGHLDLLDTLALEAGKVVQRQGARQLPGAVGSEIEEDHAVAVARSVRSADRSHRRSCRLDELVGDAGLVPTSDELDRRLAARALAVHDRVVRSSCALPPVVAIHAVVAAAHGRDPSGPGLAHHLLELADKPAPPSGDVSRPSVKACTKHAQALPAPPSRSARRDGACGCGCRWVDTRPTRCSACVSSWHRAMASTQGGLLEELAVSTLLSIRVRSW